jgi:hypothetical protein
MMNKFVLILFGIVLISLLGIGTFYFYQTGAFSLSTISLEEATKKAAKNCKNTGFYSATIASDYIISFIKKIGADKLGNDDYLQVTNIGDSCWGVWLGRKDGKGTLFWEDNQGKIYKIKAGTEI